MSELGAGIETPLLAVKDEGEVIREERLEIVGPRSSELVREASRSIREGVVDATGQEIQEREMERLPVVVIKGLVWSSSSTPDRSC